MKKLFFALAALALLATTMIPASAGPTCISQRMANGSVITTCY